MTSADKYESIIRKYQGERPDLSKTKLAKLIVEKEKIPIVWDAFRKLIPNKVKPSKDVELEVDEFEIDIPNTWYDDRFHFHIPKSNDNILLISDLQMPFHAIEPLRAALRFGKDEGVNTIWINGDLPDFYSISSFSKDPKYHKFEDEVYVVKTFLQNLRKMFPHVDIFWKLGNHEARLEKWIHCLVPELAWYNGLSFEELFGLNELGIKIIKDKTVSKIGKLHIIHGHEYRGGGSVNVARNILLKAFDNVICSHFHRVDEAYMTPINSKPIGAWVTGCLCGLSPDFMPINSWLHGFAHIQVNDTGDFTVNNYKIVNGKVR